MCFVDFSECLDRYFDGLDVVHGGNGMGQMNLDGRMCQSACLRKELHV